MKKKTKEELLNENLKLREEKEQLSAELKKYKLNELKKKKPKPALKNSVKKEEVIGNNPITNVDKISGFIEESEVAQFIEEEEKERIKNFYHAFKFELIKDNPEIIALLERKKGVDYSLTEDPEISYLISTKKSELTKIKEQLKKEGKKESAIYRLIEHKESELIELHSMLAAQSCSVLTSTPYRLSNHPAKHILFPKPPDTPLSIGAKITIFFIFGLIIGFFYLIYKFATW